MKRKIILLILSIVLVQFQFGFTQDNSFKTDRYDTLSLQDLLNVKLTVASITALKPLESPAIVTYITAADIKNMGATDLMQVLKQIPGFDFGMDVEGVVGLAVRGNWSHEGKVTLFIDGQEMNEGLYSSLQFGNHYPLQNVERIEIIRGPGSAMYGGYAENAVINIITRTPDSKLNIQASALNGQTADVSSRTGGNIYIGSKGNVGSIGININHTTEQRSIKNYKDVYGNVYSMKNNSNLNNTYANLKASIGKLNFTFIKNIYEINQRDEYVDISKVNIPVLFDDLFSEIKYSLDLKSNLKIIPSINYKLQLPWNYNSIDTTSGNAFNISSERINATITSIYDYNENINFSSGINYFKDIAKNKIDGAIFNTSGTNNLSYENFSIYSQGLITLNNIKLITGARYNVNSYFNPTLVPRVGITGVFEKYHFKLLFSQAFRAPGTQNIELSENIKPEITTVFETEIGKSIAENSYLTLNLYHLKIKDPIIYFFDSNTDFDAYKNSEFTGTYGFELDYKYKDKRTTIISGISYYSSLFQNSNSVYYVPENENANLGLAPVKFTFYLHQMISSSFAFSITSNILSERFGIEKVDQSTGKQTYTKYPIQKDINLFLEYSIHKLKGCSISIGCSNLLDENIIYIQPYRSNHAPLPGMGRTFEIKLNYQNF